MPSYVSRPAGSKRLSSCFSSACVCTLVLRRWNPVFRPWRVYRSLVRLATFSAVAADNENNASRTVSARPEETPTARCRGFSSQKVSSTCTPRHLAGTCRNPLEAGSSLTRLANGARSAAGHARRHAVPISDVSANSEVCGFRAPSESCAELRLPQVGDAWQMDARTLRLAIRILTAIQSSTQWSGIQTCST